MIEYVKLIIIFSFHLNKPPPPTQPIQTKTKMKFIIVYVAFALLGMTCADPTSRFLKLSKDKKDKKDKTKKNQEEYYGCVCADRTGMNVFLDGKYKGRQDIFLYTTEFFIKSVEPTNIEDVAPCECVDDVERVELLDAGRGFDTFEQQDQYYYPECILECPLYGMYFPAIYGGVCYCPLAF